jgi:endoglucanase
MNVLRLLVWGAAGQLLLLIACSASIADDPLPSEAAKWNARLGRGINMGNMLEAPREGEWGVSLNEEYFQAIRKAGFDSVRIPIRWSTRTANEPPYRIEPEFLARVDRAIAAALAQELVVIVNVHHYDELYQNPHEHRTRFLAMWEQIAAHYKDQPPELFFELLNEPHAQLDAVQWNDLLKAGLEVVRKTNPERMVIIGPAEWNSLAALNQLELPEEDERLIATFHYYLPFHFTHQGASWVDGSNQWLGTTWTGTDQQKQALTADLDRAVAWSKRHRRPLFLGEFGAFSQADLDSRVTWTAFLRSQAEARGISWSYWEFASGFGAYDPAALEWRKPLLSALIPRSNGPAVIR